MDKIEKKFPNISISSNTYVSHPNLRFTNVKYSTTYANDMVITIASAHCELSIGYSKIEWNVTGKSRCHENDKYNYRVGSRLAFLRLKAKATSSATRIVDSLIHDTYQFYTKLTTAKLMLDSMEYNTALSLDTQLNTLK